MTPCFFGSSARRLFGIYEPAVPGSAGKRAVVLCNPWGSEYLYAHRSLRQLATRLCAVGMHTLRFDYFGTGDSAGDMTDADLIGWQSDIELAMEEVRDITGLARVTLAGLRLGATLAARVASTRALDVDALVMWNPIVSRDGAEQSLASAPEELARPLRDGEPTPVKGFPLTAAMRSQMLSIDIEPLLAALPVRSLILTTDGGVTPRGPSSCRNGRLDTVVLDDLTPWIEDSTNMGAVPVATIKQISEWLG